LPADKTPLPGTFLRGAARDVSGAVGLSDGFMIPYEPR